MGKKSTVPLHHHNYGSLEAAVDINTKATEALTTAVLELLHLIHVEMAKDAEREKKDLSKRTDLGIDALELSLRTHNILKREHILTLGELITQTEFDLQALRNFGYNSLEEVRNALRDRDLHLKDDPGCASNCDIHGRRKKQAAF